jgi:hypothetical protein
MGFKEFYSQTPIQEQKEDKFAGKTLKAKTDIFNFNQGDIPSSEIFGIFLDAKKLKKDFLWMKKGYTSELVAEGGGFFSTKDGEFELTLELVESLSRDRLIEVR